MLSRLRQLAKRGALLAVGVPLLVLVVGVAVLVPLVWLAVTAVLLWLVRRQRRRITQLEADAA